MPSTKVEPLRKASPELLNRDILYMCAISALLCFVTYHCCRCGESEVGHIAINKTGRSERLAASAQP